MIEFVIFIFSSLTIFGCSWMMGNDIINLSAPGIVLHFVYALFLTMLFDAFFLGGP